VGFDIEGDLRITALRPDFAHVWVKLYTETIEKAEAVYEHLFAHQEALRMAYGSQGGLLVLRDQKTKVIDCSGSSSQSSTSLISPALTVRRNTPSLLQE